MATYRVTGDWSETDRVTVGPDWSDVHHNVTVTRSVADLQEVGHGVWREGAWKVTAKYTLSGKSYRRARTFKGETAWADSQRMFDDIVLEVRYSR